jgi:hypothetical protein
VHFFLAFCSTCLWLGSLLQTAAWLQQPVCMQASVLVLLLPLLLLLLQLPLLLLLVLELVDRCCSARTAALLACERHTDRWALGTIMVPVTGTMHSRGGRSASSGGMRTMWQQCTAAC